MIGRVKNINQTKAYGFIIDPNNDEYFFHKDDFIGIWNDLVFQYNTTNDNIMVTFESDKTPKGLRARLVRIADNEV